MSPQQRSLSGTGGLGVYRDFVASGSGVSSFVYQEVVTLFLSGLPGLLGLGGRSLLYPRLFAACGRRPAFGRGVVVRGPQRISLGHRVLVDDYAVLDARGERAEVSLGDHVSVGRGSAVVAKDGVISLGAGTNVGTNVRLATRSRLTVGEGVLFAAFCYVGPGNHSLEDDGRPLIEREMEDRGGVVIGDGSWICAHSTVLDGVTIGKGAVVGAHSFVKEDVPDGAVVAGVPARVISR